MKNLWRFGLLFLVIGGASFLLPMVGMQLKIINALGPGTQPIVGGLLVVVGIVLIVVSFVSQARARSAQNN